MAKEIEILVALESDFEKAKSILAQFAFQGAKKTIDYYYYDPLRKDLQPDSNQKLKACVRLREKEDRCYVAYKTDYYDGLNWLYSDEYETECKNLDVMQKIFASLGLLPLITVDNTKYIYETDLYEIVLEDVKNLGYFLEVELKPARTDQSVFDVKQEIAIFIENLGLQVSKELNSGKPELLLVKNNLHLNV